MRGLTCAPLANRRLAHSMWIRSPALNEVQHRRLYMGRRPVAVCICAYVSRVRCHVWIPIVPLLCHWIHLFVLDSLRKCPENGKKVQFSAIFVQPRYVPIVPLCASNVPVKPAISNRFLKDCITKTSKNLEKVQFFSIFFNFLQFCYISIFSQYFKKNVIF